MKTTRAMCLAAFLAHDGAAHATTSCLDYPYTTSGQLPELQADISGAFDALTPFPGMLATIEQAKPRICATTGPAEALGTFAVDDNRIAVDASLPADTRVAILLHEIRHLDQNFRGVCPASTLTMRANARATFALEADAMAVTHLIAWTSLEAGSPEIFTALRTGDETEDIAAAFEASMTATQDPALATAAAFDAWYASDARRERYYISTCMAYLDRIESEAAFSGTQPLATDFLTHLCFLPDRSTYPCEEPDGPIPR